MKEIITITGTKEISSIITIHTHGGKFHADEVCTVALLELLGFSGEVKRNFKTPETVGENELVIDIGGGEFDHHDKDAIKYRENKCPKAAFGLVCDKITIDGKSLEEVYPCFDRDIAQPIDARDNGYTEDIKESYFAEIVNPFNTFWDENPNAQDEQFRIAVEMVKPILSRMMASLKSKADGEKLVRESDILDGNILVLEKFAPWQEYIDASILGVVFPSLRGGWNCQIAPRGIGFDRKGDFEGDLKTDGIANFVHPSGFLCGCDTKEQAIAAAKRIIPRPINE